MKFNRTIEESPTLQFAEAVNCRRQRGEEILSLGLGEPDFATPEILTDALAKAAAMPSSSRYSSPLGLPSLRQKISDDLVRRCGLPCRMDNIVITPGTKAALQIVLMALLQPGDEVVFITPAYVSYEPQVYIAEQKSVVKTVDLSHTDYTLSLERLAQVFSSRTKAIILNTPHNPTGTMLPKPLLCDIYDLARNNNAYIISDEIYERLVFSEMSHFSIGSCESEVESVVTVGGFGKSMAVTGWRVGYCVVPKSLLPKVNKLQQHINTNTATVLQQALDLAWPLPTSHLELYNATMRDRVAIYKQFLAANPILRGSNPQGGFFSFLNIENTGLNSIDFTTRLVARTGVAATAGRAFSPLWDDHVRLSLAVDSKILAEAFCRMSDFIISLKQC